GLHPRPFVLAGCPRQGAEMTTWVVSEQARGKGVGRAIMNRLQERFEVLLGAGITAAAIPLYMMAGFRFIRSLPRYVRVYGELPSELLRATELGQRLLRRPRETRVAYSSAPASAAEVAEIATAALSRMNHFVRDAAQLEWRYRRHPAFVYEF